MDLSYAHGEKEPGLGNVAYRECGVEWGDVCLKGHLNIPYDDRDPTS